MRNLLAIVGMMVALGGAVGLPAVAQELGVVQSDILVLDPEKLFAESKLGQRINQDYLAQREQLIARNRKIEAELEAEELALTKLRSQKTPDEFRKLADEFDAKVQEIRRDSEKSVRELERSRDLAPVTFMRMVEPVLQELMRDAGGAVILDIRSVLLRSDVVDITDIVISRIDAEIGTGQPAPQPAEQQE